MTTAGFSSSARCFLRSRNQEVLEIIAPLKMANLRLLLLTFAAQFLLTDARLDMTFFSGPARTPLTDTGQAVVLNCLDTPNADSAIVQEFGRVFATGSGTNLSSNSSVIDSPGYLGSYLRLPSTAPESRFGVYYCDTNTTDERDDHTRIQLMLLADNANVIPLKRTVTINSGESVELIMNGSETSKVFNWRYNTELIGDCEGKLSCNASSSGIYECHHKGERNLGGMTRVILRDCPAEMWDPFSGCNKVCVECINGGVCDDKIGDCVCPPGFNGTHCELTCGFNAVGPTCGIYCTSSSTGCKDRVLCVPDPYGCSCVSGHFGPSCKSDCDSGYFGADCALECHCSTGGCNQYTGECDSVTCATGWSGYNCQYISSTVVSFTNEKVNSGEQTTFTCVIEGYPRPSESQVSITLSGQIIETDYVIDPDNHRVIITASGVNVTTGEEYSCGVSASAVAGGTVTFIPVDLFVPPTLLNRPDTTDIDSTRVTVRWTPFNQSIDLGDGPVSVYRVYYGIATQSDLTLFGETNGTSLTVTGLQDNTTYHFTVTAYRDTTGWGNYSTSTLATTLPYLPPTLVNGPDTTDIGSTQVTVRWTPWSQDTDLGNGPVSMYRVYYRLATQSDFTLFGETTGTSLTVTGLEDNTTYHFAVTAYRDTTGWGVYSPSTPATTLCSIPGPVSNLEFSEITSESVYLTWQQPIGTNCALDYRVGYELTNRDMCELLPGVTGATSVGAITTSFNYTGLEPYSEYQITVKANSNGGNGDKATLKITTKEAVPSGSPTDIGGVSQELESLTFSWSPVECGQRHGNITSYEYQLENVNTSTIVESGSVPVDTEEMTFDDLDPHSYHGFRVRASTSVGSGNYSQLDVVLPDGSGAGLAGPSTSGPLSVGAIVAIVVVAVAFLIFSLVLVLILYKRRDSKHPKFSSPDNETVDIIGTETFPSIVETSFVDSTKEASNSSRSSINDSSDGELKASSAAHQQPAYENIVPPIKVTNLANHVKKMRQSKEGFSSEFKSIPPGAPKDCSAAGKAQSRYKNRYKNIVPYDNSRVVLISNAGDTGSDYINASYINGYNKANAFIASQGPNKETVNDFWQMVWQENTATILMTTKCVEAGKIKCEEYWPSGEEPADCGGVLVKLVEKESTADYIIRTFQVSIRDAPNSSRVVRHFQFLVWPDMGVPVYTSPVILFLRRVRTSNPPEAGPIIIHCSAGVGRTGTLIAICNMLDMKDDLQEVDVHGCVKRLREQRVNMVQTQEQYEFIYSALLEVVLSGNTSIAASSFSHQLAKLKELDPTTGKSGLESEFEKLENLSAVPSASHYKAAKEKINKNKNRFATVFALDRTRPRLVTTASEASDYINANFVDGYSQRDAYIATQMPLPQTVTDFWGMVADYHSCAIVMLGQIDPSNESLIQYWPKEEGQGVNYGPFSVTLTSESDQKGIIVRDFALNNRSKDSRVVRQFQVGEVGNQRGDSVQMLLDLMSLVGKWQQQSGNRPITVQCINGLGLSGVYCAVTSVCERAKVEQFIDVFQTVKSLRVCRTGMVETLEQYTMCYDVAMRYLASFDTYANFQ